MKLRKYLVCLFIFYAFFSFVSFSFAEEIQTFTNLTRAYEIWKESGIKFVVRDQTGHIISWGVGKLESWGGQSKWVVRDPKGHFLTHAFGKVENWRNGQTRLVLRDPKGHILTHVNIIITSNGSFSQNVVGLRHIQDSKFLSFAQETLGELILQDLKSNDTIKTKVILQYLAKYKSEPGAVNFKPVLRIILRQLNFMVEHNNNPSIKKLADSAREMLNSI